MARPIEMAYYKITVTTDTGRQLSGVREDAMTDIELYYRKAERKAKLTLGARYHSIDVVQLSSHSSEVAEYKIRTKQALPKVAYQPPVAPGTFEVTEYGALSNYGKRAHKR